MALFAVGNFNPHITQTCISIHRWERINDHVEYVIAVTLGSATWTVHRRYREFLAFDRDRFKDLKESFLPPKKLVRHKSEDFVAQRLTELEKYLRTVLELEVFIQRGKREECMSFAFAEFLDFPKYEVHAIVSSLAKRFFSSGDQLLLSDDGVVFTPLQLWAITERLKLSEPTTSCGDKTADFGHVLDLIHGLTNLKIIGHAGCIESSNIRMNSLPLSLKEFRSVKQLQLLNCNPLMFAGLTHLRRTVEVLELHHSLNAVKDLMYCDHSSGLELDQVLHSLSDVLRWRKLHKVNLSSNSLMNIDPAIVCFFHVQQLDLSDNKLREIQHLEHLSLLTNLNLSRNNIERLDNWHTKLGNVKRLILSENKLQSLKGLGKLYSLEYLDVQGNNLSAPTDVWCLGKLPCLETLLLQRNPIESSIEYRTRVLEAFGARAREVKLDGEAPSARELDTVGVRLAIRKAREDREKMLERANEEISRKLNLDEPLLSHLDPASSR